MAEDITKEVQGIVDRINTTITGEYNSLTGTTEYCSTEWARIGKVVKDEALNEFIITGKEVNESITAEPLFTPAVPLDGLTFLPLPFYITGTKIATNNEWKKVTNDLTQKTPLIWLLEIIRKQKFGRGDVREFSADLRLFFVDETDPTQFNTEDHRREVVEPMEELAESFLDVIRNDRSYPRSVTDNYQLNTFSRFGVETEQGVIQNILDANLSGVELQFTLVKYKKNCKC